MSFARNLGRVFASCLAVGIGCAPVDSSEQVSRQRSRLEYAPEPSEFSAAIGTRSFPNSENAQSRLAWRVVSAEAFDSELDGQNDKESDLSQSPHFFDGAQIANDGWSAGIYVPAGDWEETGNAVSGTNWVVLEDAQVDAVSGALFGTSYRLVNLPLELKVPFVGLSPRLFMKLGGVGFGRCCGPSELCDTEGGPENPHCPGGYCDDGTVMHEGDLGVAGMRAATGSPYISAHTYSKNVKFKAGCMPVRDDTCFESSYICGSDILTNPPWGSFSATLPVNSGACGGLGERPVSGRIVPKQCMYRSVQTDTPTAARDNRVGTGASVKAPECDGQCFECESLKSAADSNGRPRQCDLFRPIPNDPPGLPGSPNSGVCTSTAGSAGVEQAQLRISAGISPGQSGKGNCQVVQNPNQPTDYYKVCVECSASECHKSIERAQSLVAHGGANTNTPTKCNATQATCPQQPAGTGGGSAGGAAGGMGGGGAGGGGAVLNPPVTSTTPPPPAPKPVVTNRTDPKPANDTKNDHNKSVQGKGAKTQDPIAMGSGAFELREVDLSFPGAVRPLEFVRSYDSRSRDRSVLGSNWVHNWDVRVVPLNDENRPAWTDPFCAGAPHETTCIMLYVGETPQLFYREFLSGVFVPQAGVTTATLIPLAVPPGAPDSQTGWLLESADGHNLTFDTDGYLIKDVDRFGNGFTINYELTPSGRLFTGLCPRGIIEMAPNPSDPQSIVMRPQQGPVYASDSLDCRALGSLVGVRSPMARMPTGAATLSFAMAPGATVEFERAKSLVEFLQNTSGRQPGSPMPWGTRLKRVTEVKEITATDGSTVTATGRSLVFEYVSHPSSPVPGAASGLTSAGLLRAVTGPAGARIEFSYQSPESLTGHPAFLNEAFLVEAKRMDGPAPSGLSPTPQRAKQFVYAWAKNGLSPNSLLSVKDAFTSFWLAQSNCTFTPVDNCGAKRPVALNMIDLTADQADLDATFRTESVDNIIKVVNGSTVESETRYETNPFSLSFDRVVRQRWGSTRATPMPTVTPDWDTQLPEGSLEYVEAMPLAGGQDDATTAFLPAVIAARYALEPMPTGDALAKAQSSGMLLPPNSADNAVIPNQNPPIAEGSKVPNNVGLVECKNQKLPAFRSRLPGYRPSFEYYDLTPQNPDLDSATQGINVTTFQLRRSRLSCDVLARAQTSDARTTDLAWTWQNNASGQMVANRSLSRRQYVTLNANRVCAWVRDTNRDGHVRYVGLNFQGRPLVDAIQGQDSKWRFAETLYNADGNVISQRKTLPETTVWSNGRGDTRYSYLDTVQASNPAQPMPWYWARRGNVVKVVDRPRGTTVVEALETNGGASQVTTTGRFTKFEYEPLFNQIHKVKTGWLDVSNAEQLSETTEFVYDYQEGSLTTLLPILERQRALGFSWAVDSSLKLLLPAIQSQVAIPMGIGDVNGDGTVTLTGLPSLVYRRPASGGQEVSAYRWNRGGRLTWTMSADGALQSQPNLPPTGGSVIQFDYLPIGSFSGVPAANQTGFLAAIHHSPRTSWPVSEGPSAAPCPHLAGPYQWLLPSTCSSSNLASQLEAQLHLPAEVATAIVTQRSAAIDGTTTFEYHVTGTLKRVSGPDARVVESDRDVDGRLTVERLFDNGLEHSRTTVTFDALLRPQRETRTSGTTYLGSVERAFDEEGRLLYECEEFVQGGCVRPTHGFLPADGASTTYSYSREGQLEWSLDAEGLRTDFFRDARGWVSLAQTYRDAADGTRTVAFEYDDDGQTTLKTIQGGMLHERRAYDGYGRLEFVQDKQERWFRVFRSPRDVVTRVHVSQTQFGPELWYQWFEADAFGRTLREYTNGTTAAELTREVQRRAGGDVWWSRSYGERPQFTTTDADGSQVWSMDADGEVVSVATSAPASREVSSSVVRANGWLTSSTRTVLDVLGLPEVVVEVGGGNSRPQLTRQTQFTRNKSGALLHQVDPDNKSTEYEVDLANRVMAVREWVPTSPSPTQASTFYGRDRRGATLTVTDLNSELTRHSYNSFGQPVSKESPGRSGTLVAEWSYDALGRINTVTPGVGVTYQHQYNNKNQLTALVSNDNLPLRTYGFDALGRLSSASNLNRGLGTTGTTVSSTFAYDWLGRLANETTQIDGRWPRATSSVFTANAGVAWRPVTRTTTRPDQTTTVHEYDTLGREARLTRGSGTTDFEWTGELLTEQTSTAVGSFVQTLVGFDSLAQPLGWTTQLNGLNALQVDLLRDNSGRIGSYTRKDWRPPVATTPEHTWRGYAYDSMRRIARVHERPAQPNLTGLQTHTLTSNQVDGVASALNAQTWTYDREPRVGSVVSITAGAKQRLLVTTRYAGYQLKDYRRTTNEPLRLVSHDSVGRVEGDGIDTFSWTPLSELRRAGNENLQYDGLGRLVARREVGTNQLIEEYAYDGSQMVVAFDVNQTVKWSASWGPGLDNLVAVKKDDHTFLAFSDGRGSIATYVNENTHRVAATLDYTPEGRVAWRTFSGNGATTGECDQLADPEQDCHAGPEALPFGFHGAFKSPNSGLIYFRNRWLSTRTGEWLSRDPLGAVDSVNLYAFSGFDSVNFWDPLGLNAGPSGVAVVVTGGGGPPPAGDRHLGGVKTPSGGGAEAGPLCDQNCREGLGRREPDGAPPKGYLGDGLGIVIKPSPGSPAAKQRPFDKPPPPIEKPLHQLTPKEIKETIRDIPEGEIANLDGELVDGSKLDHFQRDAARESLEARGKKGQEIVDSFIKEGDRIDDESRREGNHAIGEYAANELDQMAKGKLVGGAMSVGARGAVIGAQKLAARFDPSRAGHIFREAPGHVNPASAGSQARFARLFESVASNPANLRADAVQAGLINQQAAEAGVQAFTWTGRSGQVWVTVRNGLILNAGVNPVGAFR